MPEIAKVRYTHDAMIDMIVAEPQISQNEIAARFGYSAAWVSIIINSDAFQARLAERKEDLVDPQIRATVNDRLTAVANKAMDKLMERLATNASFSNRELIEAAKMATSGLGFGPAKAAPSGPVQNLFIVPAPQTPASSAQWAAMARGEGVVVENGAPEPGVYPAVGG
jgi:hypothetical protein